MFRDDESMRLSPDPVDEPKPLPAPPAETSVPEGTLTADELGFYPMHPARPLHDLLAKLGLVAKGGSKAGEPRRIA